VNNTHKNDQAVSPVIGVIAERVAAGAFTKGHTIGGETYGRDIS
jgi:FlaG/FlaF family flagellin (archaellin)